MRNSLDNIINHIKQIAKEQMTEGYWELRPCVGCGIKFIPKTGVGFYCSKTCHSKRITDSHKKPRGKLDDHESWPEYEEYGGIHESSVPPEILEAAVANAEDRYVVEDTSRIYRILVEESYNGGKEYQKRKKRNFENNLRAFGIKTLSEYNKQRYHINKHLNITHGSNARVSRSIGRMSNSYTANSSLNPGDYWTLRPRKTQRKTRHRYTVKNNKIVPIEKTRSPLK
tara:strand:- start:3129 stop:3809 length:681 start_codon:yes stop_codon:yes gene_type:complete